MPLMGPQRTILFLIADTGAGHRSAANAIRNAITFIAQKRQEEWLIQQQAGARRHYKREDHDPDKSFVHCFSPSTPAAPPKKVARWAKSGILYTYTLPAGSPVAPQRFAGFIP